MTLFTASLVNLIYLHINILSRGLQIGNSEGFNRLAHQEFPCKQDVEKWRKNNKDHFQDSEDFLRKMRSDTAFEVGQIFDGLVQCRQKDGGWIPYLNTWLVIHLLIMKI